jgi:hypothetical protein
MRLSRRAAILAVLVVSGAAPGSAGAATLWVEEECYLPPGWLECGTRHNVVYTADSEVNRVVVAGRRPYAVALRDPGVVIESGGHPGVPPMTDPHVPPTEDDLFDPVPFEATWQCSSPVGKGHAFCFGTPGEVCALYNPCFTDLATFGLIKLALGDGADTLTVVQGALEAVVTAGAGNDTIDVRNKAVDRVDCGDGADSVTADVHDVVASNCEGVSRG